MTVNFITEPIARAIASSAWLMLSQFLSVAASACVTVLMIRALGPEPYGILNTAVAAVALSVALVGLGLHPVLVRQLARASVDSRRLILLAMKMRLGSSLFVMAAVIPTVWSVYGQHAPSVELIYILIWLVPLESLSVLAAWFDARVEGRLVIRGEIAGTVLVTAVRLLAVWLAAPLWVYAAALVAGEVVKGMLWLCIYRGQLHAESQQPQDPVPIRSVLRDAWPYFISSIGVVVFLRADIVMLADMRTHLEVGHYSAAVTICSLCLIPPVLITRSVTPGIVKLREVNARLYQHRLQMFYDLMTWLALLGAGLIIGLAPRLVPMLLGDSYRSATGALQVLAGAFVVTVHGIITGPYVLAENLQRRRVIAYLLGAAANIGLNLWLIPQMSILGAAWASLFSYAMVVYGGFAMSRSLRPVLWQLMLTLIAPVRYAAKSIHRD